MHFKKYIASFALALALIVSLPQTAEATTTYTGDDTTDIIISTPVDDGLILYGKPPKPW